MNNPTDYSNPSHFIVYVLWDVILEWKAEEVKAGRLSKREHLKPYAYGTGARCISEKVKQNDIVWVFTIPRYGRYASCPSLNAMITVAEVVDQKTEKKEKRLRLIPDYIKSKWSPKKDEGWRYVIIGNKERSRYFPINNAYPLLMETILKGRKSEVEAKVAGERFGYIGQYCQTIRKIDSNHYPELLKYKDNIHKADTVFVSYRRGWGSGIIKQLVESLLRMRVNCWLDINRLPQCISLSTKTERYFTLEIENAIKESKLFLAVKRGDYLDSKWTTLEYNVARTFLDSEAVLEMNLTALKEPSTFEALVSSIEQKLAKNL